MCLYFSRGPLPRRVGLLVATLSYVTGAYISSGSAQSCNPVVDFYPVRGPHDHGYDSPATGDRNRWTCDSAHSNSDFIKANNRHVGNDVWAAEGTPVVAASAGRVGSTKCERGPGCNTGFTDACGWYHWSGHLQRIADGISEGVWVEAGTVLGYVGKTGTLSNGVVHLHYSIHPPGNYYAGIDPWPHLHAAERNVCGPASQIPSQSFLNARTSDVDGDGLADLCARGITGIRCWPSTANGWRDAWEPIPWSDASGWGSPLHYATLRMGDVNGDGRADICGRASAGVYCALSNGTGFEEATLWQPQLTNDNGWGHPEYYTTLRVIDIDGDAKDDLCARDSSGFGCWLSDGTQFARRIDGPRWSNEAGFDTASHYGTLRMGDINGDGRSDVCARTSAGMSCALADPDSFGAEIPGPLWSNESGFAKVEYWSTLMMADISGDGKDDLCIRTSTDYRCHFSNGSGFGDATIVAELSDASGWTDPSNYQTFRAGDINGDGATDLCARSNTEMVCWTWNGAAFDTVLGPAWSDASGWNGVTYFDTIRMTDFNGDGLSDLCARANPGWRCHPSQGSAFGDAIALDDLGDAVGWTDSKYFGTIMSASAGKRETDPPARADAGSQPDADVTQRPDGGTSAEDSGLKAYNSPVSTCSFTAGKRSHVPTLFITALMGWSLGRRRRA